MRQYKRQYKRKYTRQFMGQYTRQYKRRYTRQYMRQYTRKGLTKPKALVSAVAIMIHLWRNTKTNFKRVGRSTVRHCL